MRKSISNLAWNSLDIQFLSPYFHAANIEGLEIAPTALWDSAPHVSEKGINQYSKVLSNLGFRVSAIQSLFYGRPELQIFNTEKRDACIKHLVKMFELGIQLGTNRAVFGSPKNRIKRNLNKIQADKIFISFLEEIKPYLEKLDFILTLEPNAPDYGADYLTSYDEVVEIVDKLSSSRIQPQIDTGCIEMVGGDSVEAIKYRIPNHVHISLPNLEIPPGDLKHSEIKESLILGGYEGWVVLEMLPKKKNQLETIIKSVEWFNSAYSKDFI
jgi:D-psicose/D-tagatose/L-ribulose 3-epimerase